MNIVRAISTLLASMPATDAPDSERAAYFDRKAALLERIAADNLAEAGQATMLAIQARRKAAELRGEA